VRVTAKPDLKSIHDVAVLMDDVEKRLAGKGRLLVRYSGTEPLLRVMLEGQDKDQIETMGQAIVTAVRRAGLAD
jgi:phosphoglucosamine mutase